MNTKVYIFYTNWVPYDNRNRFASKIRQFFPSDIQHEVVELSAESQEAKDLLFQWSFTAGNIIAPCYVVDVNDGAFLIASNTGQNATDGYIFPNDSQFVADFKTVETAIKKLNDGETSSEVLEEIVEDLKEEEAKVPATPIDKAVDFGKKLGIGLICCIAGFGYLYYKSHQTNVNINLKE